MEEFNILICDDDHSIVDAIEIYLKQDGIVSLRRITAWRH